MDIERVVNINKYDSSKFKDNIKNVAIMKIEDEPLLCDEDDTIYFGDNQSLLGVFIGSNSPVLERILKVIEELTKHKPNLQLITILIVYLHQIWIILKQIIKKILNY